MNIPEKPTNRNEAYLAEILNKLDTLLEAQGGNGGGNTGGGNNYPVVPPEDIEDWFNDDSI